MVTAVTVSPGPASSPIDITTDQDVPSGPPEDVNGTVISSEEALITWEDPVIEDQNGIITGYMVSVSLVSTGQTLQRMSSTTDLLLENLVPFTTYTYRVAAMTNVGIGPYSVANSFLTDETAPSSPPENVNVSVISSTSVRLSWTPPPLSNRNGIITEYRVNITEINTGIQQLLSSVTTTFVVQNLHPYYVYEFTVSAHTVDTGPYSDSEIIQMPEDIPSGFPQLFMERASSSRSITFSWSEPREDSLNGEIVSYTINITETGSGVTIQRTVPSSQTSLTVASLFPFTSYFCSIAASTSIGLGPFSTIITLTTPEDSPSMSPGNLTGAAQDSTTILLSWDAPEGRHNGIIREYRLNITEVETGREFQQVSATTSLVVGNLHPDYTYEWIATAFTVGEGPYSTTSRIMTPEDVPSGPPTSLASVALAPDSISLGWALPRPEDRNGDITGFIINITNLDSGMIQQLTVAASVSNITVPNLRPFTVYVATVSARTAVGMGPFSDETSVHTLEDAPGSHPLNSTGYALNSTHIFLDWSSPAPEDLNGILREYRITVTEGETNILSSLTTDPLTTEITVGPLHPFYIYHCTILAYTVEGGPNTSVISIRTEEAAPSGPPNSVAAQATSARSISMTWAPPDRNQQNGILRHYFITLMSEAGTLTRNVSSIQRGIGVSGVRPYTLYNCTVQAETVGLGPSATAVQVNTPQDLPTGPPQNVLAQATTPTILTLSWSPPVPERRNGLIQRYTISITELETRTLEQFNTTAESFVISGRHPFYRYSYVVAAETVGLGPYSVASVIHMPEAAPASSPVSVQSTAVSPFGFLLSWAEPPAADHNGVIRNYVINITEQNTGRQLQLTSNTISQRVESLHPFYNYTCVVSAVTVETGPYSQPISIITSEDVPTGVAVNFRVTNISSTTIVLAWEPPPMHERNGIITSYTITRVTAGNSSTHITTDLMLSVTNLRPFTTYTFDISASTSVGPGPTSSPVPARTAEAAPDGAPANVASTNITSTSLTLTWLPPVVQNGRIRYYIISVLEIDTGTNLTYQAQSHTTFSIGDLHPYYSYLFNVFAVTVEVGPASLDHRVTTLQDVPATAPESVTGSATDSRTLLISWAPPPLQTQNGVITEYVVNVSVMETGEQFPRRALGSATSLSIASLHPDYTYTFIVAAVTTVGEGPFSTFRSIKLPEDVPTIPPLSTTGRAVNSTAIIFTWGHPPREGHNGIITGYSLILTELVTNTTTRYSQMGTHIELVVGSLHPYYEYECTIAAETMVGRGPYGAPFITRTLTDLPSGVPLNVRVVPVTSRSIEVTWEPPQVDLQNGVIQQYLVMVMVQQTRASLSLNSSTTSLTIPNLHPAYLYSVEVAAVTISVGPYSSTISVTTPDDAPTGTPLSVIAAAISSSSIRISWQAPLLALQNGDITAYRISVLERETGLFRNFSTVPTDSIYVVNSLHPFYNYNCSVAAYTNELGPSDYYVVQTLPEEPSESPQNVSVTATNATSVMATWVPPPEGDRNGIIQGYTIRVVGVHTDEDFTLSVNATGIFIGNLHPYYSYKFTVATVTISHGPFSNPVTVMMPPLAPSQEVSNVTAEALSPTSLRLRWLPPDKDEWNGNIIRYTIEYSLLREVQEDDDDDEGGEQIDLFMTYITYAPSNRQRLFNNPDPRLATTPLVWEQLEIEGLQEYFVYGISIYYENSAGRSDRSTPIELSMPPAAPSGPPTNVVVTGQSESIVVRWNSPEQLERNGPILGYNITLTYTNKTTRVYTVLGNTFNTQIEGLPKFTNFSVTVAARTALGFGPSLQPPILVKTGEGVPDPPTNVKAVLVEDKGSVILSWAPPEKPNGEILGYQIMYSGYQLDTSKISKRAIEGEIVDGPYFIPVPSNQTSYRIDRLKFGLVYSFMVRGRTSPGYGSYSTEEVTIDTSAPNVAGPQGVTGAVSDGIGSTGIGLIVLGLGWLLLVLIIVVVLALYILRRRNRKYSLVSRGGKHQREGTTFGVHNTNFTEMEGQSKVNPAGGLELENADYSVNGEGDHEEVDHADHKGSVHPAKLQFLEEPPSDGDQDEQMKLDLAAQAKERALEEDIEDEEDEIDEKTNIDLGKEDSEQKYDDNEIVFL